MRNANTSPTAQEANGVRMRTLPKDEIARLGDEVYERDIRWRVEADRVGEIVAIDVDTGSWAIADSELAASDRLRAQRSDAANVWLLRVGYRAVAGIGGGSPWRIK